MKTIKDFWDLGLNIFDRLSVSSYKDVNKLKKKIILCCRVSKKFKTKLKIINQKSILNFLKHNKLVTDGKIVKFKKIIYKCISI